MAFMVKIIFYKKINIPFQSIISSIAVLQKFLIKILNNKKSVWTMDILSNFEKTLTFFKKDAVCHQHKNETYTNFCPDYACNKYLCPQCVVEHTKSHSNHKIQSIRTSMLRTEQRISNTVRQLDSLTRTNKFLNPQNREEFTQKLIRQMQIVKKGIIEEINAYFREKQTQIRRQTSQYAAIEKKIKNIKNELHQALKQLHFLEKNLYSKSKTMQVVQKANKIDYEKMVSHFNRQIQKLQKNSKIEVKLNIDANKKQQLRMCLNDLIKVVKKEHRHQKDSGIPHSNEKRPVQYLDYTKQYILNPPLLSAERMLNKNSFKIDYPNYFYQGKPFLHYFQASEKRLHVALLQKVNENRPVLWEKIPLKIDFQIPSFHRSIATQDGVIYMIGGNTQHGQSKVNSIFQYAPASQTLKEVAKLKHARSSHSILCFQGLIYIAGGTSEYEVLNKFQVFNPNIRQVQELAPSRYATVNSCLCSIGTQYILKLGGTLQGNDNNQFIELYNITTNRWKQIDPEIEEFKGDFTMLSCSGWASLTQNQVFIFGGYNEINENENSKSSFVIEFDEKKGQFTIKHINLKNLPQEQGFWNSQSINYNQNIYALQNVSDINQNGACLEDRKNILIFDGKVWKTCYQA